MIRMEPLVGLAHTVKKKRSSVPRRRLPDSKLHNYNNFPLFTVQPSGSGGSGDKRSFQGANIDASGGESKLKKLKLKVGGITHTIHTKSIAELGSNCPDAPAFQQHLYVEENTDVKDPGSHGFQCTGNIFKKEHSSRGKPWESVFVNDTKRNEPLRKSKRIPKRRVLDVGFDDADEEDEEIRYLGRMNSSKVVASEDGDGMFIDQMDDQGLPGFSRMSKLEESNEDRDYVVDEEPVSDDEAGHKKMLKKGSFDIVGAERKDYMPTTRNRALQSGKDVSCGSGASLIEFPNGLPPAAPKKQKEKISEFDQQLKKAEAAQRRKLQSEKAAREAEAEAIRKILGQDSGRKKREKEMKKQQEELAQAKAANAITLPPNTIRWVNGPTGTVVTFSEDIGLPNLLNQSPCSYPPPREKCAGPNCNNAYKYRDSKLKLPLCSLNCYRAINRKSPLLTAC